MHVCQREIIYFRTLTDPLRSLFVGLSDSFLRIPVIAAPGLGLCNSCLSSPPRICYLGSEDSFFKNHLEMLFESYSETMATFLYSIMNYVQDRLAYSTLCIKSRLEIYSDEQN